MMSMLHHKYDTHKNEALKNSVTAYAPKSKTFSLTNSLYCWMLIAAGIQILGHKRFWNRMFMVFSLDLDCNLRMSLRNRDLKKKNLKARCETKAGKISIGRIKSKKFATAKKNFFD